MSNINIVWIVLAPMLLITLVYIAVSVLSFFNAVVDAYNARIVPSRRCKPIVVDAGEKPDDEFEAIVWRLKVEGR